MNTPAEEEKKYDFTIRICHGNACSDHFAKRIYERAESELEFRNMKNIKLEKSNCMGKCEQGPNVHILHHKNKKEEHHKYMTAIKMGQIIKQLSGGNNHNHHEEKKENIE